MNDPVVTDPRLYRVVWENERVRVLEYRDAPGDMTHLHGHPDSVMVTLSSFQRVISAEGREVPVELEAGQVRWLDAQEHQGRNAGRTETHALFVELKEPRPGAGHPEAVLGPS
ncbi:cupin domain-containing protein [Amycolatopsis alkalitolerans]|uniref:Cytoplasmic protein n=1 Tax=Amycolatopsis alkalitolerans TaxID=2547244 RepID=A0A5C4LU31_9PSEU|nr:cytoplasmic protein [Amycolatopsis alkalitolerans]TNC22194.1 cytoplasmic protein [Amycolatopsis alkalitolerans]